MKSATDVPSFDILGRLWRRNPLTPQNKQSFTILWTLHLIRTIHFHYTRNVLLFLPRNISRNVDSCTSYTETRNIMFRCFSSTSWCWVMRRSICFMHNWAIHYAVLSDYLLFMVIYMHRKKKIGTLTNSSVMLVSILSGFREDWSFKGLGFWREGTEFFRAGTEFDSSGEFHCHCIVFFYNYKNRNRKNRKRNHKNRRKLQQNGGFPQIIPSSSACSHLCRLGLAKCFSLAGEQK